MNSRQKTKRIAKIVKDYAVKSTNFFANFILVLIFRFKITDNLNFLLKKRDMAILANGPSLEQDYQNYLKDTSFSNDKDFMVVNEFACSALYEKIRPKFYVYFDPIMFDDETKEELIINLRNENINNILKKTTWEMNLLVPNSAIKSRFVREISRSKYVSILFFYNVPLFQSFRCINHFLYNQGLGNMSFRNSLVCAIFQTIRMNYSRIFIFGADHSWHENLKLSETNELLRKESHFYQKEMDEVFQKCNLPKSQYKYRKYERFNSTKQIKVHEEFYLISKVLSEYHVLREYSDYKRIKIINLSNKSWIDAFPRTV